jgi:nucleoside-diphosphate-sugar epimerase
MTKCLFLAGAAGAIGRRLAPQLVSDGWYVVGTTRSADKVPMLRDLGVEPVVLNAFDAAALGAAVAAAHPEVVMHQLTDLPPGLEATKMADALVRNARLRDVGTRNLVEAAVAAGARRLIAQSIALVYADGPAPHSEDDPLIAETDPAWGVTVTGVLSLQRQVLRSPLEGVVLRYGLLYGPGTGFASPHAAGSVHVDAAARAAVLAITRTQPGVYNVAEPGGPSAISKAVRVLGWDADWRMSR